MFGFYLTRVRDGGLGEAGLAPNYTLDLAAPAVGQGRKGGITAGLSDAAPAGVKSDPSGFWSEPLFASFAGKIITSPGHGQGSELRRLAQSTTPSHPRLLSQGVSPLLPSAPLHFPPSLAVPQSVPAHRRTAFATAFKCLGNGLR